MSEVKFYTLVMAGGQGTRFWPESTSKKPKQYLNLVGEKSLLSQTLLRFEGIVLKENRFIVTVKDQEKLALSSSENLVLKDHFIFEPSGRNTAPCILLSLATLLKKKVRPSDVVAIVPSDQVILNTKAFQEVMKEASLMAFEHKSLVTIGISPHFPHTGFGYIEKNEDLGNIFNVSSFKEKPDFETAKKYLESGNYFWNAGMFVSRIDVILEEFKTHAPEIFSHYDALYNALENPAKLKEVYDQIPKNSIDYAVMEKSKKVSIIPARFDWSDLGSWDALSSVIAPKDDNIIAKAEGHFFENAKNNIIFAPEKFVALIDVDDLIVISNEQALVVVPKDKAQKVKNVVEYLKKNQKFSDLL